jgi:hypothetical protein
MKPLHALRPALQSLALGLALLLASCGGGGGVDTGGTGGAVPTAAAGPITGFGSIIVGGVRYDDSAAAVDDADGTPRSRDELRLGMTVDIEAGAISEATGVPRAVARRIRVDSALAGFVAAVDVAGESFTVLGQRVVVDAATVFDERIAAGLAGLAPGDAVEVFAEFDAALQRYRATRVQPASAGSGLLRLRGPVAEVNPVLRTLRIGSATYRYERADGVPPTLAAGTWVRLRLAFDPSPLAVWEVQRFAVAQRDWPDTDEVRLEGRVAARSGSRFVVDGREVDGSGITLPPELVVGVRVELRATLRAGVLRATRLQLRSEGEVSGREFEVEGVVSSVDPVAGQLLLRGLVISTRRTDLRVDNGLLSDVVAGRRVELRARLAPDRRTLEATRITLR